MMTVDPKQHAPDCQFRRAGASITAIECEHGYDVCPTCDPCTCGKPGLIPAEQMATFLAVPPGETNPISGEREPGIDPKTGEYSTAQMLLDEMTMGDTSQPLFD